MSRGRSFYAAVHFFQSLSFLHFSNSSLYVIDLMDGGFDDSGDGGGDGGGDG